MVGVQVLGHGCDLNHLPTHQSQPVLLHHPIGGPLWRQCGMGESV